MFDSPGGRGLRLIREAESGQLGNAPAMRDKWLKHSREVILENLLEEADSTEHKGHSTVSVLGSLYSVTPRPPEA